MTSLNLEALQQAADDIRRATSIDALNLIFNRPEISDFINRVDSNDPEIIELYESNHDVNELDVLDRIISCVAMKRLTERSTQERDIVQNSLIESFKNTKISHQEQMRTIQTSTPTLISEMMQLHQLDLEQKLIKDSTARTNKTLAPMMKNPAFRAAREKELQKMEMKLQGEWGKKAETPHYKLLASLRIDEVRIVRNNQGLEQSNVSALK